MSVKLRRYEKNPVLGPDESVSWQALLATNPAAWYDQDKGVVLMLYRAAGTDDAHTIHFGLASSSNGYDFRRVSDEPVFSPGALGFDGGCVEDPRIVRFGDWYYVTYASRPFPPGKYWLNGGRHFLKSDCPAEFPWMLRQNATATYLALTQDFRTWYRAGRLTSPSVDDRDVILFPEKIDNRFFMLHRPMNWVGPKFGTDEPAMWISSASDLLCWENPRLLAKAQFDWEYKKIGGNTPPTRTDHGWLTLYHAIGSDGYYRLGAMLLDLKNPCRVTHRTHDWIMQPEMDYEKWGFYPGVCFPCGKVVIGDTLFVYYGGAEKYVCVATTPLKELLGYLLDCPCEPALSSSFGDGCSRRLLDETRL